MRKILLALSAAATLAASAFSATASADPYPWCALYNSGQNGGGLNCGFLTIRQCNDTLRGIGGMCVPNAYYTGPAERPPRHSRKLHKQPPA